jgi:hypothetical protein|tara:strand:+ start:298 stop:624 length:327 start_codon:yes stop_codon:yes gene_type:complete
MKMKMAIWFVWIATVGTRFPKKCSGLLLLERKEVMMIKKIVHFFGFRGDEYNRAKKIWGEPDFIHPVHDRRSYIEIDKDNDVLIFANKERPEILSRYRREYTDMKKPK